MMKKKKRPVMEEFDKFELSSVSSATECTGLITHMPTDEDLEAYQEVYNYQASPAVSDKSRQQIKEGKNIF